MSDLVRFLSLAVAFFAIAVLVIAFGVGRNCSRSASEATIAEEIRVVPPAFEIKATDFVKEYLADEASAVETYNGKVGIIKGPSLLVGQSNYLRFFIDKVWAVRCFLSDEQMDWVRTLYNSSDRVPLGGTYEFRTGAGWPVGFSSLPVFVLKGKVEGINNKLLTIDLRGCTLQHSP